MEDRFDEDPRGVKKNEYAIIFTGGLGQRMKGLVGRDLELWWWLVETMGQRNRVKVSVGKVKEALGLGRTSLYRRLGKLKDQGLIRGTRGEYILNPEVVMKGRLWLRPDLMEEWLEGEQGRDQGPVGGAGDALPRGEDPA